MDESLQNRRDTNRRLKLLNIACWNTYGIMKQLIGVGHWDSDDRPRLNPGLHWILY